MFSCPQVKTITFLGFKALENEDTLLRTHIVAHDVSWAAQTGKQLLRTQNVSEQNQKHFVSRTQNLCPQQMLHAEANGEICFGNNVYAIMQPRLPGPLHSYETNIHSIYF